MKKYILYTLSILSLLAALYACENDIEIKQDYGFTVEYLPVPKKLQIGETAEMRLTLKREGRWDEATYRMRYFQPDGRGTLRSDEGVVFKPNDLYPLEKEEFRLYYTSQSEDSQTIDLYFIDSFGKMCTLSFTFNNDNPSEE